MLYGNTRVSDSIAWLPMYQRLKRLSVQLLYLVESYEADTTYSHSDLEIL